MMNNEYHRNLLTGTELQKKKNTHINMIEKVVHYNFLSNEINFITILQI